VEGAVIVGLGLLAAGLFFCWLAWQLWTYRDGGSISLLEAAIPRRLAKSPFRAPNLIVGFTTSRW
jgi:hypothetical protein